MQQSLHPLLARSLASALLAVQHVLDGQHVGVVGPQRLRLDGQRALQQRPANAVAALLEVQHRQVGQRVRDLGMVRPAVRSSSRFRSVRWKEGRRGTVMAMHAVVSMVRCNAVRNVANL